MAKSTKKSAKTVKNAASEVTLNEANLKVLEEAEDRPLPQGAIFFGNQLIIGREDWEAIPCVPDSGVPEGFTVLGNRYDVAFSCDPKFVLETVCFRDDGFTILIQRPVSELGENDIQVVVGPTHNLKHEGLPFGFRRLKDGTLSVKPGVLNQTPRVEAPCPEGKAFGYMAGTPGYCWVFAANSEGGSCWGYKMKVLEVPLGVPLISLEKREPPPERRSPKRRR